MNICVVGTGYVGLVQGAALAELGHAVVCVDKDPQKVELLNGGNIPIYEPGLKEVVQRNTQAGRLHFTTSLAEGIEGSEAIFIAVGTPPQDDGSADLTYVDAVAKEIGQNLNHYAVIVNKSTVPIGTGDRVRSLIEQYYGGEFEVASNPEFLREGTALSDFMNPDRIVVGLESQEGRARHIMETLYRPLDARIVFTDVRTAELIKYAANSFLATQISFINSLAGIAEEVGANIDEVSQAMKLDRRIGPKAFLKAGLGFGGSCFPKDVDALIATSRRYEVPNELLETVRNVNYSQRARAADTITDILQGELTHKTVAVWGLSFKPDTDDTRESPALDVMQTLKQRGAHVRGYDPAGSEQAKTKLPPEDIAEDMYTMLEGADLLFVATDWNQFYNADLDAVYERLNAPVIFDGRNMFNRDDAEQKGFTYYGIGR
jgi:UDPglucose 6-dehydrogenase